MSNIEKNAFLKLETYVKFLYNTLSLLEISKIITIGNIVLYAYGIRSLTNIDAIMTNPHSQELEQLMYDNFQNKTSKFSFADIDIIGKYWRESRNIKNKQIFDAFNISSVDELVCNPRYHMYFQGLKMYLLDHEIVKKLYRHQIRDIADFIMMIMDRRNLINKYVTIDDNTCKLCIQESQNKYIDVDLNDVLKNFNDNDIDEIYKFINKQYPKYADEITIDMIKVFIGKVPKDFIFNY